MDLPTSTWKPGDEGMFASIEREVDVDKNNCVYLKEAPHGQLEMYAVWPAGYTAPISPSGEMTVYDAAGNAVAREGDRIRASGGFVPRRATASTSTCLPDTGTVALIQSRVENLGR